jgi:hypothetical protein
MQRSIKVKLPYSYTLSNDTLKVIPGLRSVELHKFWILFRSQGTGFGAILYLPIVEKKQRRSCVKYIYIL